MSAAVEQMTPEQAAAACGLNATLTNACEGWRRAWRTMVGCRAAWPGAREALGRLSVALSAGDGRLVAGATTVPPPLMCVQDWPVEKADAVAWLGLDRPLPTAEEFAAGAAGAPTVGEVEEGFARLCSECDAAMGVPAACRAFLNWFDSGRPGNVWPALLAEVQYNLGGPDPLSR